MTNMPASIMSYATPRLRRNVEFPPWLAPVMTTSALPSARRSLLTTVSRYGAQAGLIQPGRGERREADRVGIGQAVGPRRRARRAGSAAE